MLIIVSLASAQLELVYLIPLMMSSRYKLWNYNSDDVMSFVSKMSEVEHFRKKCAYPCHRSGAGGEHSWCDAFVHVHCKYTQSA